MPETNFETSFDPYVGRYAQRTLGVTASEIRALFSVASRPEVISLAGGSPAVSALPLEAVADLLAALVRERGAEALQYGGGQGDAVLREGICEVMALEGIRASAADVVVTVGSQQGLDLISRVFLDPGDVVLAEGPSYVGALGTFQAAQADVRHVRLDADGLVPEALRAMLTSLRADGRTPKLLYTIPNFHNPAGVSLSAPRRAEVLAIARSHGLLVVEDNPYGLLGFDGDPPDALRAADPDVIYLGSFSKTFAPGFRLGWVLAPGVVREKLVLASESQVLCPPTFSQFAIARYLAEQPWLDQVKVFRELYRERRDALLAALGQLLPPGCSWTRPTGGFYVWLGLPSGLDAKAMLPRAIHARVAYVPGSGFYAGPGGVDHLRLSYSLPPPERIHEGVRRLAEVIAAEQDLQDTFAPPESHPPRAVPG